MNMLQYMNGELNTLLNMDISALSLDPMGEYFKVKVVV